MVAALVAVHPLNVEPVAWVAERKGILSSFFWALTMLAYVRYARRPSVARYALVAAPFALGLMAKQMLVTLPLALLLLDYWPLGRIGPAIGQRGFVPRAGRLSLEKAPLLALSALFSLIAYRAQAGGGAVRTVESIAWDARTANALISTMEYIKKAIVPMRLSVYYPYDMTDAVLRAGLAAGALALVSAAVVALAGRQRYLAVGWFWFLGTLVPVSQIIPLGGHAMADRYAYIPAIGLFILVVWRAADLLAATRARRIAGRALAALVLLALSVTAHAQAATWRNSFAVYKRALDSTNYDRWVVMMMAYSFRLGGRYDEAFALLSAALAEGPAEWEIHKHMGLLLMDMGNIEDALAHIDLSYALRPRDFGVLMAMGRVRTAAGKYDDAIRFLEDALSLKPGEAEALNDIAVVYIRLDRCPEARAYLRRAIHENPYLVEARKNMELCPEPGASGTPTPEGARSAADARPASMRE
jgi:Flp pilus assembly protein TadD